MQLVVENATPICMVINLVLRNNVGRLIKVTLLKGQPHLIKTHFETNISSLNTEFLKHSDCVTESVKNGYSPYVLMPNIYHQSLMSWNARRKTFNKYANFLTGRQHIFFKMHYIIVHVVANATFWQPSFFASKKHKDFFPKII